MRSCASQCSRTALHNRSRLSRHASCMPLGGQLGAGRLPPSCALPAILQIFRADMATRNLNPSIRSHLSQRSGGKLVAHRPAAHVQPRFRAFPPDLTLVRTCKACGDPSCDSPQASAPDGST